MNFEPDEFEHELRQALERRSAPLSLKAKIIARRARQSPHRPMVLWHKLAAVLVLAAVLGGAVEWEAHIREQRRRGEAAREQVLTALRITGHALDQMNHQLAAHGRTQE